LPCAALQSTDGEPEAKRARVVPFAGSDMPHGLSAYFGHWPMFLGRGLRCLRCFAKPSGDYRAWKRGRCLELKPLHSMPGDMVSDVLRAGPPGVGAPTGLISRHASLVDWARHRPGVHRIVVGAVHVAGRQVFGDPLAGRARPESAAPRGPRAGWTLGD
jgi:hypothetical protein